MLAFAEQAKVAATVANDRLENINDIFARMHAGPDRGPHRARHERLRRCIPCRPCPAFAGPHARGNRHMNDLET